MADIFKAEQHWIAIANTIAHHRNTKQSLLEVLTQCFRTKQNSMVYLDNFLSQKTIQTDKGKKISFWSLFCSMMDAINSSNSQVYSTSFHSHRFRFCKFFSVSVLEISQSSLRRPRCLALSFSKGSISELHRRIVRK